MVDLLDVSYLAGLIDADGSIQIMRRKRTGDGIYSVRISLTQVTEEIPLWVASKFGGRVNKFFSSKERRQPIFRWSCESLKAKEVIKILLPFLKLKQARAKIALEIQETIVFRGFADSLTPEIKEKRKILYEEMKSMNAKHGRNHWKELTVKEN